MAMQQLLWKNVPIPPAQHAITFKAAIPNKVERLRWMGTSEQMQIVMVVDAENSRAAEIL